MTGPSQPYLPGQYPQPYFYAPQRFAGLQRRQKRAAAWAGALGLILMGFGSSVLASALAIGAVGAAIAAFSTSGPQDSGLRDFDQFLRDSAGLWIVGGVVAGAVVLLLGMFVSVAILRTGSVRRPFAVTWSAFGISVPVLGMLGAIGGFAGQAVGVIVSVTAASGGGRTTNDVLSSLVVVTIVFVLIFVAVTAVVGWLAWWWMAHAFRERVPAGVVPGTDGGGAGDAGGYGPTAGYYGSGATDADRPGREFDGASDSGGDGGGGGD